MAPVTRIIVMEASEVGEATHFASTVSAILSGPGAGQVTTSILRANIVGTGLYAEREIEFAYRLEDHFKIYIKFTETADLTMIHGKELNLGGGTTARIQIVGREKRRINLSWVPPTFKIETIRKLVASFCPDPDFSLQLSNRGSQDKWVVWGECPEEDIPHYLEIQLNGGSRLIDHRIQITIAGREVACHHCESTGHFASRCPHKNRQMARNSAPAPPTTPAQNQTTQEPTTAPTRSQTPAARTNSPSKKSVTGPVNKHRAIPDTAKWANKTEDRTEKREARDDDSQDETITGTKRPRHDSNGSDTSALSDSKLQIDEYSSDSS